jgi:WD40 repeat protein
MTERGRERTIFVSYAHEDQDVLERLRVVLAPLVREGHVELWADDRIGAARRWDAEIDASLRRAEVAVLLISADFLASDYIRDTELPRLVEREVPLVCVPVGHCAWRDVDAIASVQWPLDPERPLRDTRRRQWDRPLVLVYEAVKEVVARLDDDSHVLSAARNRESRRLEAARPGALFGVPQLPAGYQARPVDLGALKRRLQTSADVGLVGRQRSSGMYGQGGVGKSVLAAALCHDPEVRSWFPDGIYWVSVGERADLVSVQRELARRLDIDLESTNPYDALEELREGLREHRALIVVDDVWSVGAVEAFAITGEKGRILYTTRNPSVLQAIGASAQAVDALDVAASLLFLERAAGKVSDGDRALVGRLVTQTGGVVLALSVVAAMARAGRGWAEMHTELQTLEKVFRDHPYADVFKVMRLAVDGLASSDATRYRLLGVFPEDIAVPETTVARLWGVDDPTPLLARLDSAGLLTWDERRVRLHDLQRAFVIFDAEVSWPLAHRRLLDAHRPGRGWAYLDDEEPYLRKYLLYHLRLAGEHDDMATLTKNGRWLAQRLYLDGPHAAEMDATSALAVQPDDLALAKVLSVLRRSAPLLFGKDLNLPATAATLLSRLPLIETDVADLLGPWWLEPSSPLPEPSSALLRSLSGHAGIVKAVVFAPDGHSLASGGADGTVRLWDTVTGAEVHAFDGHARAVEALAFAPDGRSLASGGNDGTVRVWDAITGAELYSLTGHTRWVKALTFSADGRMLASAGADGTVRVWDTITGAEVHALYSQTRVVETVAFAPDGRRLASGGDDGAVRVWDAITGTELRSFIGHTRWVKTVAFAPDGRSLASAGGDGTVRVWGGLTDGTSRSLFSHPGVVNALAFGPDGRSLASTGDDGIVRILGLESGAELRSLIGHAGAINAVAYAPDGRSLATAGDDGTVRVWDTVSGLERPAATGHVGVVNAVTFAPNGRTLATAGDDGTVREWDAITGAERRVLTGHARWVNLDCSSGSLTAS